MQHNVSPQERLASMAIGSLLLTRGLLAKGTLARLGQSTAGLGLLWRGLSGFCPVYQGLGKEPLNAPKFIERSIVIERTLEEVRETVGEGDPLWYESSRKIFPITAGNLLWDLHMQEIGDGRMTLIRASLSDQNEAFGLRSRLSRKGLQKLADSELRKLKDLMEAEYGTTLGQDAPELH